MQPNTMQPNTIQPNTMQPNTKQPNTMQRKGRVHSGQPTDPSNDADRAIARGKQGPLSKTLQAMQNTNTNQDTNSNVKYKRKYKFKDRRKTGDTFQNFAKYKKHLKVPTST